MAPILSGKQKLPSNLKLAVEASSQGEGEGLEEEVEGDGECMRPIYVRKRDVFSAWQLELALCWLPTKALLCAL